MHWANSCPQNTQNENLLEDVNFVLMTEDVDINEIFVAGNCTSVFIDTACTKIAAGKNSSRIT